MQSKATAVLARIEGGRVYTEGDSDENAGHVFYCDRATLEALGNPERVRITLEPAP